MNNFNEEAVKSLRKTLEETPKEVLVSLLENMLAKMGDVPGGVVRVNRLSLCVFRGLCPHPNELYLFTVDPKCPDCAEAAE